MIAKRMKSAAMYGRLLILTIRDDRKKNEKCGHVWPLFDFRDQG
jgi:hypothetical protein